MEERAEQRWVDDINLFTAEVNGSAIRLSEILREAGVSEAAIAVLRRDRLAAFLERLSDEWRQLLGQLLDPRSATILVRRFGLDGQRIATLEELGAVHGISRERVRQLQQRALIRLRTAKRRSLLFRAVAGAARAVLDESSGAGETATTADQATQRPALRIPSSATARDLLRRIIAACVATLPPDTAIADVVDLLVQEAEGNGASCTPFAGILRGYDRAALNRFIREDRLTSSPLRQAGAAPPAGAKAGTPDGRRMRWPPGEHPRFFAPWTPAEDKALLALDDAGVRSRGIAIQLRRSPAAVVERLRVLGRRRVSPTPPAPPARPTYVVQAKREAPRAYDPWTEAEEYEAVTLFTTGTEIGAIAARLQRRPRAIVACLRRLGYQPVAPR